MSEYLQTVANEFTDPSRRLFWPCLLIALVMVVWVRRHDLHSLLVYLRPTYWWHPSARLDYQLWISNRLFSLVIITPMLASRAYAAVWFGGTLNDLLGARPDLLWSPLVLTLCFSLSLFIADDFSRFYLHRMMHRVPLLWRIHRVHHSAQVLTPFSLYRIHPLESLLLQLRGLVVVAAVGGTFLYLFNGAISAWTVLGVDALGLAFNAFGANLRHSPIFVGFGRFERLLISPAMHQIHHSSKPEHFERNFGTCLSVWDKLWGSRLTSRGEAVTRFGVATVVHRNVFAAWFEPMLAIGKLSATTIVPMVNKAYYLLRPSTKG